MRRRAQVSIEYILIVAFVFAILIPGVYFFYTYSQNSAASLASAQYAKLGQEMLDMAVKTTAQGQGSWLTLDANIPDALQDITVLNSGGSELIIRYQTNVGASDAVFFSDTTLSAKTLSPIANGTIFLNQPHSGKASFRFTAGPSGVVAISETYG